MAGIGIVIVSHSRQLALGVRELAAQMVQNQVPIAVAAGIEDPENPLGTDPIQVYEAIASVFSDDGVLVLMDLGSALLSAEMAIEFLPEAQQEKVYLCEAPLVEGAIAAVVAAAAGRDIHQVMAEARGALLAKATQLGVVSRPLSVVSPITTNIESPTREIRLLVSNRLGLHARPAAQFVATAARFQSQILVRNLTRNTELVRGDSINQVTTLGVRQGHELVITATGSDADEALAALQGLFANNFGEAAQSYCSNKEGLPNPESEDNVTLNSPPAFHHEVTPTTHGELSGIAASAGVAIAPVVHYQPTHISITEYHVNDPDAEWQRLQAAINTARQEIQAVFSQASLQIGDAEAAIFDAQLLFLEDPVLLEAAHQRILDNHINAEAAWQAVVDEVATSYRALEDSYLQERVDDVVDVGRRVLRLLGGKAPANLHLESPAILVATDLTPSDTAGLDPTKVLGICTTLGSATSHSAIIARTLGIPAVLGVDAQVLHLVDGTLMALDGESGKAWVEPESHILDLLAAKQSAWQTAQQEARATAHQPAITHDGRQVSVFANIGSISDVQVAVASGAEGVGLLRTEFLYLDRTSAPTEEEQLEVYQAIAQVLDNRPLIIRTLDVGGDKPLPYIRVGFPEANPFLGWRGIRFCLDRPELFKTQLRAILRASVGHQIKIMLPMIATVTEIRAAKVILGEVQAELTQAGIAFDAAMKVGIMVEVPSAVAIADQLAAEVDFFSIGTNDLSQYVMASDRTNPRVANLVDALNPAVLRMLQQTVQAAHAAGISVGLCGELAADTLATPILLGLGLDELSVNPQSIPGVKQAIARLSIVESEAIAASALQQDSAKDVRELISTSITPPA
ncbi:MULTISPECIES: phosphoenolpyruvate--protein phosphotransferase [unclassified Nostoc]|uniref:phosphoenolpyruvate--protein phosphotransferase n=1 Tax=unclassified Nostoc TaxID=2593658 RepID=UPI0025AB22C2|nr:MULTISPECIES: phosphoenolpyruvate--protein phosphotransferase [unclassified Nostoc]MDM9583718.1 phosphoenolpyruvate--protein phosphotransferase [Nostoc sp. GT001]MDZ7945689.1 phosphoenolpyruvate--protein phosphotransferase [Nostoc sp. EfeVER01]MDZ7995174.1 phosphoenolpyruvate--protein phosphotransferase [Nostoc sp. EspVER01]